MNTEERSTDVDGSYTAVRQQNMFLLVHRSPDWKAMAVRACQTLAVRACPTQVSAIHDHPKSAIHVHPWPSSPLKSWTIARTYSAVGQL